MYLTATSLTEFLVGIEVLPGGKRKEGLAAALADFMATLFGSRVLPFNQEAAAAYAPIVSRACASGTCISIADGQIAAIAAVCGFSVATRDTAPFLAAGLPVINPQGWEYANLSRGKAATHAQSDRILDPARNVAPLAACCTVGGTLYPVLADVPLRYWLLLRKHHAPTYPLLYMTWRWRVMLG